VTTRQRVSVVMPAWRASQTIRAAAQSVLAQEVPVHELIIVDDGSPEDLRAPLEDLEGPIRLVRQENAGAAAARNRGIDLATGDWVAFLDADDEWAPEHTAVQLAVARAHPEVGFMCARYHRVGADGERLPMGGPPPAMLDRVLSLSGAMALRFAKRSWTGTVMVRRDMLAGMRFRTDLRTAEDRELWWRLVLATPAFAAATPIATYRLLPGTLSRTHADDDFRNMLTVLRLHASSLSAADLRAEEVSVFARWTRHALEAGQPQAGRHPAREHWRRRPLAPRALWQLLRTHLSGGGTAPPPEHLGGGTRRDA